MTVNRPYTFELARQLLAAYDHQVLTEQHHEDMARVYANAERNGVDRATLERAAHTLQRLAPADVDQSGSGRSTSSMAGCTDTCP